MEENRPTVLYLDTIPGERIQETTLAGIRRYAAVRGWDVVAVPREKSRPAAMPALLAAHWPVAGCVVECSDARRDLPPRLFGKTPGCLQRRRGAPSRKRRLPQMRAHPS
jgi:hypothetical protein